MEFFKLANVKKGYGADSEHAFQCQRLTIGHGTKLGIVGENGSGKSTLLRVMAGLEKPEEGQVLFRGERVYPKLDRLISGHPELQYLSQHFELPKFVTVGSFLHRRQPAEKVAEVTRLCQISELLDQDTRHLSGGEKQRVALAHALMSEPSLLLLDEPFSNLDPLHKRVIKQVVGEAASWAASIVLVAHDPADLLPWADELWVLKDGRVIQQGPPRLLYFQPKDAYVAALLGDYQEVDPQNWSLPSQAGVLARPEQFEVSPYEGKGSRGLVKKISFMGSHDLLHITLTEIDIYVRSAVDTYQMGDQVRVKFLGPTVTQP